MDSSEIEAIILLKNNSPLDEFCGLTPNEMNRLLYEPFGSNSVLSFQESINNETLDQIPFFRLTEEFVKLVHREKHIKLTPLGALTKKVMVELYEYKFIPEYLIEIGISKLWKEQDSISIMTARYNAQLAGIVKKSKGKISLTKLGEKLLKPENRLELFKAIFNSFSTEFNWGFMDGYPEAPVGQLGFGFTIYLLERYGSIERPSQFYSEKYLKAFPKFIYNFEDRIFSNKEDGFHQCYCLRTFERFLEWYGFVTISKERKLLLDNQKVKTTELFRQVFKLEIS
jgi:hypothetical protein